MTSALVQYVQEALQAASDPAKAGPMAAYMKTTMPFYGVQKPQRTPIQRALRKRFKPANRAAWQAGVEALWRLPHREEKYLSLCYARQSLRFIDGQALPLLERLIREGAWWDLVDEIAVHLLGPVLRKQRELVRPLLERWIDDDDLWIRRSALIAHNRHGQETDSEQLFRHCLRRAGEKEFFIRKAIGWALREYSYHAPEAVRDFLRAHRTELSGLSYREGAKQLLRQGLLQKEE